MYVLGVIALNDRTFEYDCRSLDSFLKGSVGVWGGSRERERERERERKGGVGVECRNLLLKSRKHKILATGLGESRGMLL